MHIIFGNMVKFQFLAQWSVNHFVPLVASSFLLFFTNLQFSLIMWCIISYLSPHNLHILFCWDFPIFALTLLVLITLSCAAIKRYPVSLLRFFFLTMSKFSRVRFRLFIVWNIHIIVFFYFCFLVTVTFILVLFVLFLVTVIRPSLLFFM